MLRVRRRGTIRSLALVLLAMLSASWLVVPAIAGAGTISQTQKAIADLSAALNRQEQRSEISANEYDADEANLASINTDIVHLQAHETRTRTKIKVTTRKLVTDVVRAFVLGASSQQITSLFDQNVTRSDARTVYENEAIGNLNELKVQLQREKHSLSVTVARVANQRAKAQTAAYNMKALLEANVELQNQTQATLSTVKGKLKVEIINYEIQAGAAAARSRDTAAEQKAITAATAVGGQSAANQVIEAEQAATPSSGTVTIAEVGSTAQGLAAVRYAESQLGVPYVWGGETPGVGFDCSGLVQWAWGKAGISIPRTTETQWPALLHVSPTELQPGDLLFYYNLDGDDEVDHVVMYVGSGPWGVDTTIAAPYTGADVSLAPLFTAGLIGEARP
ncbi:MAG TPA: NlpC/P60 family protein [Acidimicrobiales bacterium]|jgi:peptidoglycan DL-endopeptidase CwlO|nr:NlpC/P60 family protein [Acidimicrobiales bacterium]